MKLTNKTAYDTAAIKRILCEVHNELARLEGHRLVRWKRVHTQVVHRRAGYSGTSGWAYINGTLARLRLAKPNTGHGMHCSVQQLIRIAWHEYLHLYGYTSEIDGSGRTRAGFPGEDSMYRIRHAAGFKLRGGQGGWPLPLKEDTPRALPLTTTQLQLVRYQRLLDREAKWLTKQRRARNALKKIASSRRYYEKQLRAAGEDV